MTELTPELARELASSSVTALKPGDVLAVRLPSGIYPRELQRATEYGELIEARTGVKVAFIPGEEFAHVTLNVTVNVTDATPEKLAGAIRREITEQMRAARGDVAMPR